MNNGGMNNQRYCPACGAPAAGTAVFCIMCGEKLEKDAFCASCGSELPDGARFCQTCGARADAFSENVPKTQAVPIKKNKQRKYSILTLIRSCLLVLISLVMLTFCFFSVASYDISLMGIDTKLAMSPVRNITLFIDSFGDYNAENIKDCSAYKKIQDTADELSAEIWYLDSSLIMESIGTEDIGNSSLEAMMEEGYSYADIIMLLNAGNSGSLNLSLKSERLMNKLVYQSVRLSAQSDAVTPTPLGALNALFSLVYIIVCVAFVVISVLNLILLLFGRSVSVCAKKMLDRTASMLLPVAPLMTVLTYFTTVNFVNMEGLDSIATIKLGLGTVAVLIAGVVGVIACVTLHIVEFSKSYSCRGIVTHSIALGTALLTLCLVFTPVMTTKVKTVFSGSSAPVTLKTDISSDYFDSLNFSDETYEKYKKQTVSEGKMELNELVSVYKEFSKSQIKNELAKPVDYAIMTMCIAGLGGGTLFFTGLFATIPVFLALAALMAALVAWQSACYLCTGRSMKSVTLPAKILLGLLGAASLALIIVFVCIVNYNLKEFSVLNYITGISAGLVAFVAGAFVTAAMPMLGGGKKRVEPCREENGIPETDIAVKVEDSVSPTIEIK